LFAASPSGAAVPSQLDNDAKAGCVHSWRDVSTQRQAASTQEVEERLTIWPPAAAACLQPAPSGAAIPSQHSPADQPPFWSCLVPLQPSPDLQLQTHTPLPSCAWQPEPTAMTPSVRLMQSIHLIIPCLLLSCMHFFIHSFLHSLVCMFVVSFIHMFIPSFIQSFIHSLNHSAHIIHYIQ